MYDEDEDEESDRFIEVLDAVFTIAVALIIMGVTVGVSISAATRGNPAIAMVALAMGTIIAVSWVAVSTGYGARDDNHKEG